METYRITSKAGVDHGTYSGNTPQEALVKCFREAGYTEATVWLGEDGALRYVDSEALELLGVVADWRVVEEPQAQRLLQSIYSGTVQEVTGKVVEWGWLEAGTLVRNVQKLDAGTSLPVWSFDASSTEGAFWSREKSCTPPVVEKSGGQHPDRTGTP